MIRRLSGVVLAFLLAAFLFAAFAATAGAQQGPAPANLGDGVGFSPMGIRVALIICLLVFALAFLAGARTTTRPPGTRKPTQIQDRRGGGRR